MTHEEKELDKLDITVKKGRAKHELVVAARDEALEKYIPIVKAPKLVKAKAKVGYFLKPKAPAWVAQENESAGDVFDWFSGKLPSEARVRHETKQGRFVVLFLHRTPRMVSYTRRGLSAAAALVLNIAWDAHQEAYRKGPPWDLDELAKLVCAL